MNTYGTICYDFDGVVHSYKQPWQGHNVIPDEPTPGAIKHLQAMLDSEFNVAIFSVRSEEEDGRLAIRNWLVKHGMSEEEAEKVELPTHKPKALLYIDDRAYLFNGENWPTLDFIRMFHPWNRDENHQYLSPEERKTMVLPQKAKTGPMRFGRDWRGLFIRGKDARKFELAVRTLLMDPKRVADDGEVRETIQQLLGLLQHTDEQEVANGDLQQMADFPQARAGKEAVTQ